MATALKRNWPFTVVACCLLPGYLLVKLCKYMAQPIPAKPPLLLHIDRYA